MCGTFKTKPIRALHVKLNQFYYKASKEIEWVVRIWDQSKRIYSIREHEDTYTPEYSIKLLLLSPVRFTGQEYQRISLLCPSLASSDHTLGKFKDGTYPSKTRYENIQVLVILSPTMFFYFFNI